MPLSRAPASLAAVLALTFGSAPAAWAAAPTKRECVQASEAAQDLRGSGKLHEARAQFVVCMSSTCPRPVREDCAQRLAEIDKVMPTLVLVARDADGNDLVAATVTIDGSEAQLPLDGKAIDLDPGPHHLEFHAGDRTLQRDIVAHEGDKERRIDATFAAPQAPPAALAPPPPPPPPERPADDHGGTQRWVGIGFGIVGAAGLIAGSVLGLVSKATYDHAFVEECGRVRDKCTAQGTADGNTAHTEATASTASFIGGGALLAAGAALYFTAPGRSHAVAIAPAVGDGAAGLTLRGTW
jgi:hypothetical protein